MYWYINHLWKSKLKSREGIGWTEIRSCDKNERRVNRWWLWFNIMRFMWVLNFLYLICFLERTTGFSNIFFSIPLAHMMHSENSLYLELLWKFIKNWGWYEYKNNHNSKNKNRKIDFYLNQHIMHLHENRIKTGEGKGLYILSWVKVNTFVFFIIKLEMFKSPLYICWSCWAKSVVYVWWCHRNSMMGLKILKNNLHN